jgi:hypothetical protein
MTLKTKAYYMQQSIYLKFVLGVLKKMPDHHPSKEKINEMISSLLDSYDDDEFDAQPIINRMLELAFKPLYPESAID